MPDESSRARIAALIERGPDPDGAWERLMPILEADPDIALSEEALRRACALAGTSRALSQTVARYPSLLLGLAPQPTVTLRVRAALASIAADDMANVIDVAQATARFSDEIDHIVADALETSRVEVAQRHPIVDDLPFSVVAMGKWGARELNYASDIDLIFAHDNVGNEETPSRAAALALAARLISALSSPTVDGPGLEVDADLRPEGSIGPLSR
ncbi:MAG: hypothetical protein M3N43_11455, partial [Actinomycetota bacterium]|nr:hypothetical protein [Actinomycetota bacterium]